MKSMKPALLMGAVCVLLASTSAFAQTSDAMAAPSAKSMRMANHQLAKKVRMALTKAKPTIPLEEVVVLAKKGVVSLVGEVENADQSAEAEKIATGVAGVASVNNQLGIAERGE